jgi:hypothetical protein
MRHTIERDIAAGFQSPDEIAREAIELYSDDQPPSVLAPIAERLTAEAIAKHSKAQATWPAVTDCDRLDKAFAKLNQRMIVARQNFSDCGTCGVAEIAEEMEKEQKPGQKVRGYTFYHMQDTERAVEGGGLYLNYGSIDDEEKIALEVANEIVDVLQGEGLETEWDGTWQKRIRVKLDWKRRR